MPKTFVQPEYPDFRVRLIDLAEGEPDAVVIEDGDASVYIETASIPRLVSALTKAYGKLS